MSYKKIITAPQSRGARAMLGWSRDQLAERSHVGIATLADFEAEKRTPYDRTLADIRQALEESGIEFIDEEGRGVGVFLRYPAVVTARAAKPPARKKAAAKPRRPAKKSEM